MYRNLSFGDRGADVLQLQTALRQLGGADSDPPGYFGNSTIDEVEHFWTSIGADPTTLFTSDHTIPTRLTFILPSWDIVFLPDLPSQVLNVNGVEGEQITNPFAVLSRGPLRIVLPATSAQKALVAVGNSATLSIAGQSNRESLKATVVSKGGHQIALSASPALLAKYAGQRVDVTITYASSGVPVLAIPASALISEANGGLAVDVVQRHGLHEVRVAIGLVVGGTVGIKAVSGNLSPGNRVLIVSPPS
jgi:hypothetical protein